MFFSVFSSSCFSIVSWQPRACIFVVYSALGENCTSFRPSRSLSLLLDRLSVVFSRLCSMSNTGPPRSTFNSLSAGLLPTTSSSTPSSSAADSVVVTAVSSATPASDYIAAAVAQALRNSLPVFVAALRPDQRASVTSAALLPASSGVPSSSPVTVHSSAAVSGTLTLPPFVPTFSTTSTITGSGSARLSSITAPVMSSRLSSWPMESDSLASSDKAFVVGPGHAPIPAKLVKKITNGEFVELADLLSPNLRAVDQEPQTFLDGKLLVSKKRRLVEIADILTWTEAFTIFQMVLCTFHPHRWPDLSKYKLLIIQTARKSPGQAWLEYDLAFRKDAAATGAADWSKMNLDLYNFHLRSPAPPTSSLPSSVSASTSVAPNWENRARPPHCSSWNRGRCLWPFGNCRFRHICSSCNGDHPRVRCPFHSSSTGRSRSPPPWDRGSLLEESNLLQHYLYIVFLMFRFALTSLVDCLVQELHVVLVQLSHIMHLSLFVLFHLWHQFIPFPRCNCLSSRQS